MCDVKPFSFISRFQLRRNTLAAESRVKKSLIQIGGEMKNDFTSQKSSQKTSKNFIYNEYQNDSRLFLTQAAHSSKQLRWRQREWVAERLLGDSENLLGNFSDTWNTSSHQSKSPRDFKCQLCAAVNRLRVSFSGAFSQVERDGWKVAQRAGGTHKICNWN